MKPKVDQKNIQIHKKIHDDTQENAQNHIQGVPEYSEGTNLDEKDMPDRFQALLEVKTGLKIQEVKDFKVQLTYADHIHIILSRIIF